MSAEPVGVVKSYFDTIHNDAFRQALMELRQVILTVVPDAHEVISYGMPCYKKGKTMVGLAAFKKHVSFYPGAAIDGFEDQLSGFKTSRGTIQFTPEKPIPYDLVVQILKHRFLAETAP